MWSRLGMGTQFVPDRLDVVDRKGQAPRRADVVDHASGVGVVAQLVEGLTDRPRPVHRRRRRFARWRRGHHDFSTPLLGRCVLFRICCGHDTFLLWRDRREMGSLLKRCNLCALRLTSPNLLVACAFCFSWPEPKKEEGSLSLPLPPRAVVRKFTKLLH